MATKKTQKKIKAFTPAKKAKMVAMLKKGDSVYSIAKTLDLTPSVARYHANRIQGKSITMPSKAETKRMVKAMAHAAANPKISPEVGAQLFQENIKIARERDSAKEDYENIACAKSELEEEVHNLKRDLMKAQLKSEILKEMLLEKA